MNNDYLLTVCVPTYNRLEELKVCLAKLLPQITDEVEVFVSDNSTNNDTKTYVENLFRDAENLHYKKNEVNLGADGNFLQCMRFAHGKFTTLLSDDDFYSDDYIPTLLEFIKEHDDVAIIETDTVGVEKDSLKILGNRKIRDKKVEIFEGADLNEFISRLGVMLTFVSTIVFRTDLIAKIENPEQYSKTMLLQTYILFLCLSQHKKAAYLTGLTVFARIDNTSGYNIYKVFVTEWEKALRTVALNKGIIDKKHYKMIINHTLTGFVIDYMIQEKKGKDIHLESDGKLKYFKPVLLRKTFYTRVLPIMLLPKFVIKILKRNS